MAQAYGELDGYECDPEQIYDAYDDVRAIEMAEQFPQAQVIGVDITPLKYR